MSDFIIEDIETAETVNPHTDAAQALVNAGEGKQLTITVERGTKRDGTPGEGSRDKLLFQQAANALGFTARVVKVAPVEDDETKVKLSFKLRPINKRAGKPRGASAESENVETVETVETGEVSETPASEDERPRRRR